jgi:4-hydroxybenzoate polyprenyltransferase
MGTNRWVVYQRERFPLAGHVPLVAAFSGSAVSFSALLRDPTSAPDWRSTLVAFITSLLFFFQLRVADEFKDASEDARYRPYRPVPRGLVTLRELGALAGCALVIQATLAAWLAPSLLLVLIPVWGYLLLMQREFFAAEWLRERPLAYIATHMAIVPMIDLYATACDWRVAGAAHPPAALTWFLVVSLGNGFVIELGRKIRAPTDEEYGVATYSALWGRSTATRAWLAALSAAGMSALVAARAIDMSLPLAAAIGALFFLCVISARRFVAAPAPAGGTRFEALSWVWTVSMYVTLGLVPLAWRTLGA